MVESDDKEKTPTDRSSAIVPWLDRSKVANASPPQWVRAAMAAGALGIILLLFVNAGRMAPLFVAGQQAADAQDASANPPPALSLDPALVAKGKALFAKQGCISCHSVAGKGGDLGPDLSGTGTRNPALDWQIQHLKEPASVEEGSTMPSFKRLSEADLRALAVYMLSLK